ncbi:MAG: endonuclease/exonuclease/phosphatase family protein [Armatimonadetes bacterium]|nr:endonuclease/exonuclease/phosphatase family protein [Armatimonadota bacterium]
MRIVTYNIRGGLGCDGVRSLARVADTLRGLRPDVVCLQEVHRFLPVSRFADQPAELERLLGFRVVFHPVSRLGVARFGNAVATRLPIVSIGMHRLTNDRERERPAMRWESRGLLELVVDAPGGPLRVMTTHWSLNAMDRLISSATVAEMASGCPEPLILCGDLNALPDSLEVARLVRRSGLADAASANPQPTYPADAPNSRIDVILHSPKLGEARAWTASSPASDHLPLVAEWG